MEIRETFINASEGHMIFESEWYTAHTTDKKRLFRDLQREYGRCTGKVYRDTARGTKAVGWVFQSRQQYEDAHRGGECRHPGSHRESCTYIREVWVSVRESADVHALDLVTV